MRTRLGFGGTMAAYSTFAAKDPGAGGGGGSTFAMSRYRYRYAIRLFLFGVS